MPRTLPVLDYPYSLLTEALGTYMGEVFRDDEARNRFLVHIQPLVRHCAGRTASVYGGGLVRQMEDVVSFINTRLLSTWLDRYLSSTRKSERVTRAVKYFSKSVRGLVLDYVKAHYDDRTIPLMRFHMEDLEADDPMDRDEIEAACDRLVDEHVALRPRPDLDLEVVRRLARYRVMREYRENDGAIAG